ncbi:MAG: CDP-alcohol phosphatidyltransferase family protein [Deltaproteobacteria bacterium]|nr:CDP-alcohol phosphatidyltransferase family protein [Deltaproteobacteria bacterium]
MPNKKNFPQKLTALLIYGRPPLVFGGMVCAIAVMWNRSLTLYVTGVFLLLISMTFDVVDGWFAARFPPHATLANLADRIMDKIVYSTIFPLVSVGMMWRLIFIAPDHTRPQMLHAILVLLLCITVLIRDNFAHYMRSCAIQKGFESETLAFTRLRTMVAAPVGALLYIHAFFLPGKGASAIYVFISWLANLPLRTFFIIEIIFLIINFGSIAGLCRKYGTIFLDEVCHEDDMLRRRILSFFPNALTAMNALMGILAVLFAHQGWIRQAYLFLIGAAIFDKLDGALARKLGLTTPPPRPENIAPGVSLGGLLDDIADGISFCLAPALIFHMTLTDCPQLGLEKSWVTVVASLYFLMGVGRLIYFTMDRSPIPGFFKGMPTPAAALLVTAPLLMFRQAAGASAELAHFWGIFCLATMIVASLVMNLYPVHYLHIGRFMDRNPWFRRLNIVLLISLFTPYFGYIALTYLLIYFLSPILTHRMEPPRK